jgi:hypothetical protein
MCHGGIMMRRSTTDPAKPIESGWRFRDGLCCISGGIRLNSEPLDLMARLAALIPPPRMHPTCYHGVFAAHILLRAGVTPAKRGVGATKPADQTGEAQQPQTQR